VKTFFLPLRPASFFIFLSLLLGIFAGGIYPDFLAFIYPILFFISVFICFSLFLYKRLTFILFLGLIFACGFLSIQSKLVPKLPAHHISHFLDTQKIKMTARVISFKKHHKKRYSIIILLQSREIKNNPKEILSGKLKLNIYGASENTLQFGDIIQFSSRIKSIKNFKNPGGFDYKRHLKLKGIYGTAYTDPKKIKVLTTKEHMGFILKLIRKIENIRTDYYDYISSHTKDSESSKIIMSLITGKKEIISPDMRDLFSKAGVSHLLAISGLHLSIVSILFFSFFNKILSCFPHLTISGKSKKMAGVLSLFPIIGYAIFTGFSPSTQRALIMIIILLLSFVSEKEKDIVSSLSVAGILILILDSSAVFSISFQLSFIAVAFIIGGISVLKEYLFIPKNMTSKILLMICVTVFANLGTFPLTAHYFNIVSLISLVSNLIFIPIIGFIVLPLGLISLVCFSCFPLLALFIFKMCNQIVLVSITVLDFIALLPFSWSRVARFHWEEIIAIYLLFVLIFLGLKFRKKILLPLCILIFSLMGLYFSIDRLKKTSSTNLSITILDMGQANCALIQTPEEKNILVDGGGFSDGSTFDTGRFIIAPLLWQKGIWTLDYVILSHPESDHMNGLIYILNNFDVKTLIKNNDQKNSSAYTRLMKICKKKQIKIFNPSPNSDQINFKTVNIYFFESHKEKFLYNLNNNSLVFKVVHNRFSMLFPGDILNHREKNLSSHPDTNLYAEILLSPHHGSLTSSSIDFLSKVTPKTVIISCGLNNRYGFPNKAVIKRYQDMGIHIFRTDKNGAIFISSDGINYNIKAMFPNESQKDIF